MSIMLQNQFLRSPRLRGWTTGLGKGLIGVGAGLLQLSKAEVEPPKILNKDLGPASTTEPNNLVKACMEDIKVLLDARPMEYRVLYKALRKMGHRHFTIDSAQRRLGIKLRAKSVYRETGEPAWIAYLY